MADSVFCREIIQGAFLFCTAHFLIDAGVGTVSQENRPCLGIAGVHMADPVLFFFCPCIFMLLDYACFIIVNGGAGHNPSLRPALHCQLINIITPFLLCDKGAVLHHPPQGIMGFLVNRRVVCIHSIRQLGFCPVNPQKTLWVLFHGCFGLLTVVHIVRERRYFFCPSLGGPDCGKRSDYCHLYSSLSLSAVWQQYF